MHKRLALCIQIDGANLQILFETAKKITQKFLKNFGCKNNTINEIDLERRGQHKVKIQSFKGDVESNLSAKATAGSRVASLRLAIRYARR